MVVIAIVILAFILIVGTYFIIRKLMEFRAQIHKIQNASSVLEPLTDSMDAYLPGQGLVPIIEALDSPEDEIRVGAAVTLGFAGDDSGAEILIEHLKSTDQKKKKEALCALRVLRVPEAFEALVGATKEEDPEIRLYAIWALGNLGDARGLPYIIKAMEDPIPNVRICSYFCLPKFDDPSIVPQMLEALKKETNKMAQRRLSSSIRELRKKLIKYTQEHN